MKNSNNIVEPISAETFLIIICMEYVNIIYYYYMNNKLLLSQYVTSLTEGYALVLSMFCLLSFLNVMKKHMKTANPLFTKAIKSPPNHLESIFCYCYHFLTFFYCNFLSEMS